MNEGIFENDDIKKKRKKGNALEDKMPFYKNKKIKMMESPPPKSDST